ncbi:MAG: SDR family oxidoreductase [Planctomycetota bacterium]
MELADSTAIITGSTGKLGSAITLALARKGCRCICHYNTNSKYARQLTSQINSLGQKAFAVQADLTDPHRIESLFDDSTPAKNANILINSAAIFLRQPVADVQYQDTQKLISLNLIAPILLSSRFARNVECNFPDAEKPVAKIINLADIAAIRPWPDYPAYCSSKAGLIAATRALAKALAPRMTVNAVAPGIVSWPENFSDQQKQRQIEMTPAGRTAAVEEITSTVLFLLHNDYITGQVIAVDGGRAI